MLSVKNLTYNSNRKLIFKNLSASFNDGEIIGITGPAGSGKSTFINLLKNNKFNQIGDILIDGQNIKTINKKKLRTQISHYSSAHKNVNPEAIVREWILSGRQSHKRRLSPYSATDIDIAQKMMSIFKLEIFSETRLKLISETSRNMATLAKTFSAQSDILLLEKPDAGLNINQRVLLSQCLKKYTSDGKHIVILTSADLNFIAASCDRIIVLADNDIAETGTHRIITAEFIKKYFHIEAVVTKNIYSGLPEIQIIQEG